MPTTAGPPDYFALVSYNQSAFYSSSVREDGQTAVMHAQVKYDDLLNFEQTMRGFVRMEGTHLRRFPPQEHYERGNLFVSQIDYLRELSEPTADPLGNLNYKNPAGAIGQGLVEVAVTYEPPRDGMLIRPDSDRPAGVTNELWRAVGRRIENEVTSQQLPKYAMVYSAASSPTNKDLASAGAIVIATATLYYTVDWPLANPGHPEVYGSLETNINSCIGTINSVQFDGKYPPYTLLCLAPKRQLVIQADGSFCCRMTYVFAQRGVLDVSGTSNDTTTPDWTRILNGSNANTIFSRIHRRGAPTQFAYNTTDFTLLFTP